MRSEEKWGLNREGEATETLANKEHDTTHDTLWTILPDNEEKAEWQENWGELSRSNGLALDQEQAEEKQPERHRDIQPDDLLSVYLAEMSQEPLLTFEQEVELARQIEKGHQAQKELRKENCTADEYTRLQDLIEAGQAAREHLGRANTRLVISIAKRYRGYGIPFSDLIQNGNVGLMRAVDRYNHRSGNRFSTYATWWIRQAVTRSLANQGRVIRIPVHMGSRMREMAQVAQRLEVEYRRQPSPEEIAEAMNESPAKIRQMMRWSSLPLSLDQPVGEDGDADLGEFIEDDNLLLPDDLADAQLLNETLDALLNNLTAREARILRLRYGLLDGQTRTLHQVAVKFGLSRERIRQIEREALAKLRLVAPKHRLEHFLTVN
jgi:RNA polymerase primary sigma factor